MATYMIFFQVELIHNFLTSPKITHKFLALERLTLILLKSLTNPIVFLLFSTIFLFLVTKLDLTALKIITYFYLPWKESIVFT